MWGQPPSAVRRAQLDRFVGQRQQTELPHRSLGVRHSRLPLLIEFLVAIIIHFLLRGSACLPASSAPFSVSPTRPDCSISPASSPRLASNSSPPEAPPNCCAIPASPSKTSPNSQGCPKCSTAASRLFIPKSTAASCTAAKIPSI